MKKYGLQKHRDRGTEMAAVFSKKRKIESGGPETVAAAKGGAAEKGARRERRKWGSQGPVKDTGQKGNDSDRLARGTEI